MITLEDLAVQALLSRCASPIERCLVAAIVTCNLAGDDVEWVPAANAPLTGFFRNRGTMQVRLSLQHAVPEARPDSLVKPRYRLDAAMWWLGAERTRPIAIECDGHDFHERTREQARRDRRRDRDLTALGWDVFRFTGSEIHHDPDDLAQEIWVHIIDAAAHSATQGGGA